MNEINVEDYGTIGGSIDCTATFNAALAAAINNNCSVIRFTSRNSNYSYRFTSKPNAIASNIKIVSAKSETCILLRDYNASSADEPFIDMSDGGGCEGLQITAATGTTGGIGLVSKPSSTGGFQNFYDMYITYQGTGAWGTCAALLSGANAADGLRDIHYSNNWVFGKLILDHVINIGGSANYAGDVVIRATNSDASSDPTADVQLDFIAANSFNISNCYNFAINCAYANNASGCVNIASSAVNGNVRIGNYIAANNVVNSGNSTSVITAETNREGIWTPVANGLSVSGTPTYAGKWKKIGNTVFFSLTISSTGSTTSISGQTWFSGFPFTPSETGVCAVVNANRTAIGGVHICAGAMYMPSWNGEVGVVINGFCFV